MTRGRPCPRGNTEMPIVSPGHTARAPDLPDTRTGADNQPRRTENGRTYCANPRRELSDSQPTYAVPGLPPATAIRCPALLWSGVTRRAADQVRPWLVE